MPSHKRATFDRTTLNSSRCKRQKWASRGQRSKKSRTSSFIHNSSKGSAKSCSKLEANKGENRKHTEWEFIAVTLSLRFNVGLCWSTQVLRKLKDVFVQLRSQTYSFTLMLRHCCENEFRSRTDRSKTKKNKEKGLSKSIYLLLSENCDIVCNRYSICKFSRLFFFIFSWLQVLSDKLGRVYQSGLLMMIIWGKKNILRVEMKVWIFLEGQSLSRSSIHLNRDWQLSPTGPPNTPSHRRACVVCIYAARSLWGGTLAE